MKKVLFAALFAVLAFSVSAQTRFLSNPIYPNLKAYSTGGSYPAVWNATTNYLERQTDSTMYTRTKAIVPSTAVQTASHANDTLTGKYLTVVTASRKDTLTFKTTLYTTGQVLEILCTNASNDSTYVKTTTGNINGASTYWFTGTYKAAKIYFDGTNYWILNKQ